MNKGLEYSLSFLITCLRNRYLIVLFFLKKERRFLFLEFSKIFFTNFWKHTFLMFKKKIRFEYFINQFLIT